jgi:hypothetical protein
MRGSLGSGIGQRVGQRSYIVTILDGVQHRVAAGSRAGRTVALSRARRAGYGCSLSPSKTSPCNWSRWEKTSATVSNTFGKAGVEGWSPCASRRGWAGSGVSVRLLTCVGIQTGEFVGVDALHDPRREQSLEEPADPCGALPSGGDAHP